MNKKEERLEKESSWIFRRQLNEIKDRGKLIDYMVGYERRTNQRFVIAITVLFLFVYASLFGGYYYGHKLESKHSENFKMMTNAMAEKLCPYLGYGKYVNAELQEGDTIVLHCELRSVILE